LREKFHIEAELVLPSTINRLERTTGVGQSLFDLHPFVVVSIEFIKSSRYRDEFINRCPEFVIVDEAHTCAFSADGNSGRHLRHQLLAGLAADPQRHLLLVTATPHSGDEGAFRSLLGLLQPEFARLLNDLTRADKEKERQRVAQHLVQRRRADIRQYMDAQTPFPVREESERSYGLSNDYHKLFDAALAYARERIGDGTGDKRQQRVRWWSALALLRSLASSPAAAAATLRTRSVTGQAPDALQADQTGERTVLDLEDAGADEYPDLIPGAQEEEPGVLNHAERDRLLRMARQADALCGPQQDAKLKAATAIVLALLNDGYNPILFCRFIATADYVADELRKALPRTVEIQSVTGKLPPFEREQRVAELGRHNKRILVATDCLSEGVNLQEHFNAVVHYDLSWNPTRHEQREGRVDRYGQPSPTVRTLTFYGTDNQIDGVVLDVLLRKHKTIRTSLGVSVPVPGNTNDVVQALLQGIILRGGAKTARSQLSFMDLQSNFGAELAAELHRDWDNVTEKEKRSRTVFAQQSIKVDTVAAEWASTRAAIGSGVDVERFVHDAVVSHGGLAQKSGAVSLLTLPARRALRDAFDGAQHVRAVFELPVPEGATLLTRMHPAVEEVATYLVNTALDPLLESVARRTGALRTQSVSRRTTLLLVRLRHHIVNQRTTAQGRTESTLLAEECLLLGFQGAPEAALWLSPAEAESLLAAEPAGNLAPAQAATFVQSVLDGFAALHPYLAQFADERAQELLSAHQSVRQDARQTGVRTTVRPQLPVDVLGVYVLLPG
jgi:superfamily II DNA or RNA helicase